MKKKGFTLVELLAVIAILAILVIIALPNIMNLFNEAKKRSFTNEIKELFKTAENQWMSDSMINTNEKYYARGFTGTGCTTTELKLSGRTQLNYGIRVDKAGKIVSFVATDGTYAYQFSSADGLKIENIGTANAAAFNTPNAVVSLAEKSKSSATITYDTSTKNFGLSIS